MEKKTPTKSKEEVQPNGGHLKSSDTRNRLTSADRNNIKNHRSERNQGNGYSHHHKGIQVGASEIRSVNGVMEKTSVVNNYEYKGRLGKEDGYQAKSESPKINSSPSVKSKSIVDINGTEDHFTDKVAVEGERKEKNDDVKLRKPPYPSMMELRAQLPAGRRRTLLLSTNTTLDDRVADLNDL